MTSFGVAAQGASRGSRAAYLAGLLLEDLEREDVSKAIPHMQAVEMMHRFNAKGKPHLGSRALALSRRSGRVQQKPAQTAYTQALMRDKIKYRHEMALALRDEGMEWSPPKRRGVSKAALRLKAPTTSQKVMWGGAGATAAGAPVVSSRLRRNGDRRGSAVAGGVAGAAGTKLGLDLSGYALREGIKHHVRRVDAGEVGHPMSRKQRRTVESAHRKKHGITSGTMHGAPMKAWRDFPKELPAGRASRAMGWKNTPAVALGVLAAGTAAGAARGGRRQSVAKVDVTMSDREAKRLAGKYDTRGPLPKGLSREQKMKAYEARYVATGGKKAEKWHRRAEAAEVGRNVGLVGATTSAAALLAARGKRTGPVLRRTRVGRQITPHRTETAALSSALGGGYSELYGEHARSRRASYRNSPGGVAGSALSRMQAYTPTGRKK